MKLRDGGVIFAITVIAACVGYAIFQRVKPDVIPHDNAIEEFAEDFLEDKLGLPDGFIDLTPSSPELSTKECERLVNHLGSPKKLTA